MTDVLTFGETMGALRADGLLRLGGTLRLSIAGSEATVAIGLARSGPTRNPAAEFTETIRDLPISVGNTVQPGAGGGRIDVRGREDTYEFTASGATAIRVTQTSGCEAGVFADIRDLTNGTFVGSANPLCGNELGPYQLPDQTHRYAIVVRSVELKVGDYGFRLEAA